MDWLLKEPSPTVMHIGLTSSVTQDRTSSSRSPGTRESREVALPGYEIGPLIHQSSLRSVYRATRLIDGLPVIIKTLKAEYPSKQDVAALRREFHIIEHLKPVEGIIRAHALEAYGNGNVGPGTRAVRTFLGGSHRDAERSSLFTGALLHHRDRHRRDAGPCA